MFVQGDKKMTKISLPEKKKNQKIDIIINDALHYFEENGYDNTTIDQLCEAAMISSSTFFNYFGTKEKLVELIILDVLDDFRETAKSVMEDEISPGSDPFDSAEKGLLVLCDTIVKYCNTISVFHRIALQRDDFREIELEHCRVAAAMVKDSFEKAGRPCPFTDDHLMVLIGGCFTHPFLILPPEEAAKRARDSVREMTGLLRRL